MLERLHFRIFFERDAVSSIRHHEESSMISPDVSAGLARTRPVAWLDLPASLAAHPYEASPVAIS